jgi:tetratricopeptide (TPR) repeat protein
MMPNCPRCETRVAPGAKFCTGCGMPVASEAGTKCGRCGGRLAAGVNFCTECGGAVLAAGVADAGAAAQEPEEQRCSRCKNLQPRRVCGEQRSPYFQAKIDPKGRCDFFVLNPAQVYWKNGMIDALRGDRDAAAAAAFEAAIRAGLPQDDELAARFALGEQYKQLVFNSGMEWQQCVSSRQFEEAIRQIGEALKIDREGGYGYFAELLNRGRLRTFDLMCMLDADAILERGDRPGAIAYLQHKVGLCSYLASCPLLNVLLKLGGLYLDEGRLESAQIMFTNVVAAEPVDRVDEEGTEQAIRAEARERLRAIPSRR